MLVEKCPSCSLLDDVLLIAGGGGGGEDGGVFSSGDNGGRGGQAVANIIGINFIGAGQNGSDAQGGDGGVGGSGDSGGNGGIGGAGDDAGAGGGSFAIGWTQACAIAPKDLSIPSNPAPHRPDPCTSCLITADGGQKGAVEIWIFTGGC